MSYSGLFCVSVIIYYYAHFYYNERERRKDLDLLGREEGRIWEELLEGKSK